MLGTHKWKLYFPKLVYLKEVKFGGRSDDKKSAVYALDWAQFDGHILAERVKWFEQNPQANNQESVEGLQALPEKYDNHVKSLTYAIPPHYKREINRLCNVAVFDLSVERPFDTNIREMLYSVGEEAIKCAFKLVSDCTYDEDENYFYHGDDKFLIWRMLVYRFWVGQTGRGLPWYRAEIDKLEMEVRLKRFAEKVDMAASREFIDAIKKMEEEQKNYTVQEEDENG